MALEPITGTVRGLDFTPRLVHSSVVAASPTAATETIIATLTLGDDATAVQGIELIAFAAFTIGTAGVSGNLKIRQTDASGATIAATGIVNAGVWAATQLTELYVAGFDTAPTLPGQVYVATLTVGSANAGSTVSGVYLRALTVQPVCDCAPLPRNNGSQSLRASVALQGGIVVYGFTVYNTNAAAQFLCMFDADAVPADGQVPIISWPLAAHNGVAFSYAPNGRRFDAGLVLCNSSTDASKTIGAADCLFDVQYDVLGG